MKKIYKYPLEITERQVINMPGDVKLLTVQMREKTPYLWALVEPGKPERMHGIQIFGTGLPADDAGVYIATFQTGPLVFHVFEDRDVD